MFTRTRYGAKLVSSEYFGGLGLTLRILLPLDISTGFKFNNISVRPHIRASGHKGISREDGEQFRLTQSIPVSPPRTGIA